jgi:hypothetical protein
MAASCVALLGILVCVETQKTDCSIEYFKCARLSKKYDMEYVQTFIIRLQNGSNYFGYFGACPPSNG